MKTTLDKMIDSAPQEQKDFLHELSEKEIKRGNMPKFITEEQDRKTMGEVLKKLRKQNGLTQKEVGQRLGLKNPNFISNLEKGDAAPPKDKIHLFSSAYGVDDHMLNFAIMKYMMRDWWKVWFQMEIMLSEVEKGTWPEPFVFDAKVDEWVKDLL